MGWEIIALGTIEFRKTASIAEIQSFTKAVEKLDAVIRTDMKWEYINIEMSGNKGIDYHPLSELMDKYNKIIDAESVSFGEYSETGDGFYWERTVEDE